MNIWNPSKVNGHEMWTGSNGKLELSLIPSLGSKVTSLKHLSTGTEWLADSGRPLGNKGYASPFPDSDMSGWDEMFPSINCCTYPEYPWEGIEIPDHGEVWSIPWQAKPENGGLKCAVHGIRFPYKLEKTYQFLSEQTIRIRYSAHNLSPYPFSFLWAAHPLFRVVPGMKMIVPEGMNKIVVSYSQNNRLGKFGDENDWPVAKAGQGVVRLDEIDLKTVSAEKYYFKNPLNEGWAALYNPQTKEKLTIRFPVDKVPYLAVWSNCGGFENQYHFAIEPSTGLLDDLRYASKQGEVVKIQPLQRYDWHMDITLD